MTMNITTQPTMSQISGNNRYGSEIRWLSTWLINIAGLDNGYDAQGYDLPYLLSFSILLSDTLNQVFTSFPKRINYQVNSQPGQLSRSAVVDLYCR
jgi:hypothetical protein